MSTDLRVLEFFTKGRMMHETTAYGKVASFLKGHGIFLVVLLFFAYAFSCSAAFLVEEWSDEKYSHGFLTPLLTFLMAWHRLAGRRFDPPSSAPSWRGLLWMLASLFLLFFGEISTFRQLSFLAFVVMAAGLVLVFLGRGAARAIWPAFILLLLAVPLPFMLNNQISFNMRLVSSSLGVWFLSVFGYSVFQEGNIIDLGDFKLQVVDACNGLRYLFPAISLSFLIAYLMKDRFWKKAAVFLSAAPITIIMNSLRIALVGVTVDLWGTEAAEGLVHFLEGYVIFFLCIFLLMVEASILLRVGGRGSFDWGFFGLPRAPVSVRPAAGGPVVVTALFLAVFAASATLVGRAGLSPLRVPDPPRLALFPSSLGPWRGHQSKADDGAVKDDTLTSYLYADYSKTEGGPSVNLFIAYYGTQGIDSAAHSPATCSPGGGWVIESISDIVFPSSRGRLLPPRVARLLIALGDERQIVYYWFPQRGRELTDQFSTKWYLFVDSIFMRRTDGALARLSTPIYKGETERDADLRLRDFLENAYFDIKFRLPAGPHSAQLTN